MKIAMANDHAGTALKNDRRRVKKVEEINNQYCVPVK